MPAWLGADGMTPHPSEQLSAAPMGSFTLTQAFGHDPIPGTALPYVQTDPADWWISQPGPLYNTMQHCSSGCAFTQGDPNEHLYYETPYYNYAVVIDYNREPVRQGAGSAFFLHVTRRRADGRLRVDRPGPAGADHALARPARAPADPDRHRLADRAQSWHWAPAEVSGWLRSALGTRQRLTAGLRLLVECAVR